MISQVYRSHHICHSADSHRLVMEIDRKCQTGYAYIGHGPIVHVHHTDNEIRCLMAYPGEDTDEALNGNAGIVGSLESVKSMRDNNIEM